MLGAAIQGGTLAQWLMLVALVAGSWVVWRGGGGTAISTLETANRVLEHRVQELERLRATDQATIAELRAKTDVGAALVPVVESLARHEERAQQRSEAVLNVLDLIAVRLGPDNGGSSHD